MRGLMSIPKCASSGPPNLTHASRANSKEQACLDRKAENKVGNVKNTYLPKGTPMNEKYTQLRAKLVEITSLENAIRLLHWDRETYMPPGGAVSRGEQIAFLTGLHHDRLT